jgi:predicted GNAT superfamily acetyltransferase
VAGIQAVAGIEIRQLYDLADFAEVVRLQELIWGFDPTDLLPMRFLVVVSRVGGHVFGAFDGHQMVAFCFAMPGIKPGPRPYLHSHMLGVLPAYRDGGLGRALKLRQRAEALARGIDLIEWTFDPLELKNAFFNIERLGAIVRRYSVNQYGITASPLHGGLPTDRCYAEWWTDSARARAVVEGSARPTDPFPAHDAVERISYPADMARIRKEERDRACEIQARNAGKFQSGFARGLAVTRFQRSETEGTYILEPWQ